MPIVSSIAMKVSSSCLVRSLATWTLSSPYLLITACSIFSAFIVASISCAVAKDSSWALLRSPSASYWSYVKPRPISLSLFINSSPRILSSSVSLRAFWASVSSPVAAPISSRLTMLFERLLRNSLWESVSSTWSDVSSLNESLKATAASYCARIPSASFNPSNRSLNSAASSTAPAKNPDVPCSGVALRRSITSSSSFLIILELLAELINESLRSFTLSKASSLASIIKSW